MVVVHWMHEQSGRMEGIVKKFLTENEELTSEEIEILKWYIDQWVDAMPVKPPKWREKLAKCNSKKELRDYNWMLVRDYCIDPF